MIKPEIKDAPKAQKVRHFFSNSNNQYRSQRVHLPAETHTHQNSQIMMQQSIKNQTLDDKKLAQCLQRHNRQLRQLNQSQNELAQQISRERVSTENDGISKKQKYLELALQSCLQQNKTLNADRQHLEKQLKSLRRQFQRVLQQKQKQCSELTQKVKIFEKEDRDKKMKKEKLVSEFLPNLEAEAEVRILRERLQQVKQIHCKQMKEKEEVIEKLNKKLRQIQKANESLQLQLEHLRRGAKSQLKKIKKTALSELKKSQKQNLSLTQKIEKIEKSLSYHQSMAKDHLEQQVINSIQAYSKFQKPFSAKQKNQQKQQKNDSTLVTNFHTQIQSNYHTKKQIKTNHFLPYNKQIELQMNNCQNLLGMPIRKGALKKGEKNQESMIDFFRQVTRKVIEKKEEMHKLQENKKAVVVMVLDMQRKLKKTEEKISVLQNQNSSLLRSINKMSEEAKKQKISFQQTYQLMTQRIKIIQNKFAEQYKLRLFELLQKQFNQQNSPELVRLEFLIQRFIEHVTNSSHQDAILSISQKRSNSLQNQIKKLKSKSKTQLDSSVNAMNFDEELMTKYAKNITLQAVVQKQYEQLKLMEEKGRQNELKIEKQQISIKKLEEESLMLKKQRLKTAIKYQEEIIRREQFAQNIENKINRIDKIMLKEISTQTQFNTPYQLTQREASFRNFCQF